jgi:choline dehydrogenase-like flavoprotein
VIYSNLPAAAFESVRSARGRVVVVGAGTLGLYLAALLMEKGWHVTIVEAGTATLDSFNRDSYRSIGRPHQGVKIGRSKSIGGTSNLWGGQLVEFSPADFNGRSWIAGSAWPITYDEVAPYFARAYERLGIDPTVQSDDAVWRARVGATPSFSGDVEIFLSRWMKTPSTAVMYADAIRHDERLLVLAGHTVVGFRGAGSRVRGVVVRNARGSSAEVPADRIVIAAGTIETVRLLMAAAQDPAWRCPWKSNRMLGLRFQDHLGGRLGIVSPTDQKALVRVFATLYWGGHKFQPKLRVSESACLAQGLLGAQGIVMFESSATEHLVYLKQFLKAAIHSRQFTGIADLCRHAVSCARHLPPVMWTYITDHRMFVPFDSRITLNVQAEQVPTDRSRITIDPSRCDSTGLPQAVLDWQITGEELPTLRDLAYRCARAFEAAGLGRLTIEPDLVAMAPSFLDSLHDTYHAAGGAIMGTAQANGVVDSNLRVFGTENVYIASAATFPTSSSGNVTFTALALATRLADHL